MTPRPGRFTLEEEIPYPLYRRLGGPQGWSGRVRKILSPNRDSIPGPSSPYRVAVPTALSRNIDDDDGDEIRYVSRN